MGTRYRSREIKLDLARTAVAGIASTGEGDVMGTLRPAVSIIGSPSSEPYNTLQPSRRYWTILPGACRRAKHCLLYSGRPIDNTRPTPAALTNEWPSPFNLPALHVCITRGDGSRLCLPPRAAGQLRPRAARQLHLR